MIIGSVNAYAKQLKLQTEFQMKQARGQLGNHETLEQWLGDDPSSDDTEKQDTQLKTIRQKLDQGGRLTFEERRYLQAKDPQAYAKLEAAEREQRAFEQKLRQCRTREEAQRLKLTYLSSSMATVKAVERNSNLTSAEKLAILVQEKQRCDRLEQSSRDFVRRGEYHSLPTDAEAAKACRDTRKAEKARRARRVQRTEDKKKAYRRKQEKKGPRPETPEQRKVRRANAKARANAALHNTAAFMAVVEAYRTARTPEPPQPQVDVKG